MTTQTPYRKKLIEVDLPLDVINQESKKDASLTHGHPSTMHKWWARRPLAACRAVIFASMVDDPGDCPEEFPSKDDQDQERERLHNIIKRMVPWANTDESNPLVKALLNEARYEIARSVARTHNETAPSEPAEVLRYLADKALPIYDPFCGGGSIPLEAQRLGLKAIGSDLNPVAVLITKALVELPPKFANRPPVNPEADRTGMTVGKGKNQKQIPWRGTAGLANDIRYYGKWMREEAFKRIGHHYPEAKLPNGGNATVIAWMWARTIPCPNPACSVAMPLMKTFQLQKNQNSEHWTTPVIDRKAGTISWKVQDHKADGPARSTADKKGATCISCNGAVKLNYVREQSKSGNLGLQMTAIIASADKKRIYLTPSNKDIQAARDSIPNWIPSTTLPEMATKAISLQSYGWTHWQNAFTPRQLLTLTTFSDILKEVRELLIQHSSDANYTAAVVTYLAFAISRTADSGCSFAIWESGGNFVAAAFSRQGLGMVWDFPEANPFSTSTQNWMAQIDWIAKVLEHLPPEVNDGAIHQADASDTVYPHSGPIIVTDPPYYDNVYYSDTSDFFYAWLRPLLRDIYPDLFASILTPKSEEMIANRYRFPDSHKRFEDQLAKTLNLIRERCTEEFPSSIFYAYKQQEEELNGVTSTGWETMLGAVIRAGFRIVGTWPMRTENPKALKSNRNALASSVVLVCRPRPEGAPIVTRRQFLDALENEMPAALDKLTHESHIAPVDLAQAAIGPGMQVYSRYSRVETIGGEEVTVREALAAINRVIAEYDERLQGELDLETRFCLDWLRQNDYNEGRYDEAATLARAKDIAVEELRDSHRLLTASGGAVSLLPVDGYGPGRGLRLDEMTAWEGCCRMAYHLSREDGGGTEGAATVARVMGSNAESVERLARILYNYYDRKGDSRNSVMFNNLVTEWSNILTKAQAPDQGRLV